MSKLDILIVGAGMMGRAAAYFFRNHPQGPYKVLLTDADESVLDESAAFLAQGGHLDTMRLDVTRSDNLIRALTDVKVCLSCVPYFYNPMIAKACLSLGVSYVDLGLKTETTDEILGMDADAKARNVSLVPDTGFSPGLINILVWELVNRFKKCDDVRVLAGGLPQVPTGPLNYTQFFSIHGLVNEYFEDAREIRNGKMVTVPSLSDLETVQFPGVGELEAFVTSGGTSTLPRTLEGKVNHLSYKTLRYPGHMASLQSLRDLGLAETHLYKFKDCEVSPREMLIKVLEAKLPKNVPDVVLLRVVAKGDGGREEKIELTVKENAQIGLSAMEQLTGFSAAAVTLAVHEGKVPAGAQTPELAIPFGWMKDHLGKFGIAL